MRMTSNILAITLGTMLGSVGNFPMFCMASGAFLIVGLYLAYQVFRGYKDSQRIQ